MRFFLSLTVVFQVVFMVALARATYEIIPSAETVRLAYVGAYGVIAGALGLVIRAYAFKVGGLTFMRLGRLSLSFCITRQ